jgi:hypothetical protein
MPSAHDLQVAFAAAVLTGAPGRLPLAIAATALGAERRIRIYRNHFTISLTDCLGATFPVLKALVGEPYFNQCARRFASQHPPVSPVLFEYGEAFPPFVADTTGSEEFAYLADVGAFEWAINGAYHADDAAPIDSRKILSVPQEHHGALVLHLHPSARLVTSSYPVLAVWRANQPGADGETVDLRRGGDRVLVWRKGLDVGWRVLDTGETAFLTALLARSPLAAACALGIEADAAFQPGPFLNELFAGEMLTGFSLPDDPTDPDVPTQR